MVLSPIIFESETTMSTTGQDMTPIIESNNSHIFRAYAMGRLISKNAISKQELKDVARDAFLVGSGNIVKEIYLMGIRMRDLIDIEVRNRISNPEVDDKRISLAEIALETYRGGIADMFLELEEADYLPLMEPLMNKKLDTFEEYIQRVIDVGHSVTYDDILFDSLHHFMKCIDPEIEFEEATKLGNFIKKHENFLSDREIKDVDLLCVNLEKEGIDSLMVDLIELILANHRDEMKIILKHYSKKQ